jgi:hypothetical protein
MTCLCLYNKNMAMPAEVGGSLFTETTPRLTCRLQRDQEWGIGGANKCEATPETGPCWVWQEERPGQPDQQFQAAIRRKRRP